MEANKILCVGNWESDVGYAWWLMERFWEAIALRYPGRVTISYKRLGAVSQRLIDTGAQFIEYDFDVNRPLAPFVKRHGFRHLYLTDKPYICTAYARLRMAGVKNIVMHDHMPGERIEPAGIKRLLKAAAARVRPCAADAYIAVSELGMRRFSHAVCLPEERCHLARNGVDMAIDIVPTDIRSELGLPRDAVVIVSCGRATKYKGVHHIIEAARRVNAHFVHLGDGPDLESFRQTAPANYHFLGKRSDVAGILASADIAVHASAGEGLSLAILEFMRAGLPIVLTNSPTVSQSVQDSVSALLYEPGHVGQLVEKLSMLVSSASLRASLGSAAKVQAQSYNIDHTVAAVLNVFDRLRV